MKPRGDSIPSFVEIVKAMRRLLKWLPLLLVSAPVELPAQPPAEPTEAGRVHLPPPIATADRPILVRPCLGAGYIPYSYPAVDSCPCARDDCFPPARYYCGGEAYRDHWWSKWLRAHFAGGSMLDGYPCHCVFPTVGRPIVQTVPEPSPDIAPSAPQPDDRR